MNNSENLLADEIEESKEESISNSKKDKKVKTPEKAEQAEANAEVEVEAINGTPRYNKKNK